jgi:1-acyl-sn-glycerol-3-phosphate acyltransferase
MTSEAKYTPFAGRAHDTRRDDLRWALTQPHGAWSHRLMAVLLRKTMRESTTEVTFDETAFRRAMAQVEPGSLLVLAPSHRSYLDFLLMGYLCFHQDALGIPMPHIAAAEEFGKMPVVGWLLRQCHAFYVQRGVGKANIALNQALKEIVAQHGSIMFFPEGQRSRSRLELAPKRGLLRGLQGTGRTFSVLPIAIGYERLPEEYALERELTGGRRSRLSLTSTKRWWQQVRAGEVELGHIHITCGAPLVMNNMTDVHELSQQLAAAHQRLMPITQFHLRAFLQANPIAGIDEAWLRQALKRRGCLVLDSDLECPATLSPVMTQCFMNDWQHWFYGDVLARIGEDDHVAQDHIRRHMFGKPPMSEPDDARVTAVVEAILKPVRLDYQLVMTQLGIADEAARGAPLRYTSPLELVRAYPTAHLPYLEDAYAWLAERGVLAAQGKGVYGWGAASADAGTEINA